MNLKQRLIKHEGLRLRPYADTLGKMTIGVGRCLTSHGISPEEAYFMLDNDLHECQLALTQALPWTSALDENRKEVLIEMIFQLGLQGFLKFPSMIAALKNNDFDTAAKEMLNSSWHTQTPARCEELAQIMLSGQSL